MWYFEEKKMHLTKMQCKLNNFIFGILKKKVYKKKGKLLC